MTLTSSGESTTRFQRSNSSSPAATPGSFWCRSPTNEATGERLVRITGGKFGGRVLVAPEDDRVRPTSDKVRQAIFNVLRHRDFGSGFSLEGASAVDLF